MNYGWTLNRESWVKLASALNQRPWRSVSFSIYEKPQVPITRGVYVFCARPYTDPTEDQKQRSLLRHLLNAVYVGQAVNLRKRFDDHYRKPMPPMRDLRGCFRGTLEFWFTSADSLEELCLLEGLLIDCLGPTANRHRAPALRGKIQDGRPA